MTTQITLRPASEDRRRSYGVLFESETVHTVSGRGVHNPSYPYRVQVWINQPDSDVGFISPDGGATTEALTFLLSTEPIVIATTPTARKRGEALAVGQTVQIERFGEFKITARDLRDPELVRV